VAGPRFLLFSGTSASDHSTRSRSLPLETSHPSARGESGGWTAWRLLSRNNRELGRSPDVHATVAECVAAVERLRTVVDEAARLLSVDDRDGRWCWRLVVDGVTVAVSARSYHRQRECVYSLDQFVVAVAVAQPPLVVREVQGRARGGEAPDAGDGLAPTGRRPIVGLGRGADDPGGVRARAERLPPARLAPPRLAPVRQAPTAHRVRRPASAPAVAS